MNFVIDDAGTIRPALVVRVWGPEMANLHVFWDGSNDKIEAAALSNYPWPPVLPSRPDPWMTSVTYERTGKKRTFYRNRDALDVGLAQTARKAPPTD